MYILENTLISFRGYKYKEKGTQNVGQMEKRRPKNGEIMNLKGKNIVKHREIVITREKKRQKGEGQGYSTNWTVVDCFRGRGDQGSAFSHQNMDPCNFGVFLPNQEYGQQFLERQLAALYK
jgi:hypothetical protein